MGVVETALSYIGKVKYVFGSDNIDGGEGDCSSFTETVFRKNGYEIGTDTETQWTSSLSQKVAELQSGDLIFFKDTYNNDHTDGVSHVGIYNGNGNFVHLSSSGVVESSLSDSYYSEHYLGAKRVSGASSGSESVAVDSGLSTGTDSILDNVLIIILCFLLIVGAITALVMAVK